jgi:ATP-dependent DNA helicase DinG
MIDMASARMRDHLFGTLVKCLGDGGLAAKDGFEVQPGQRDYAQRWTETLARALEDRGGRSARPHLLMLGADTGTGKTIGYAVPALTLAAAGQRVAIATNTHMLQRQMLGTKDKPGDLVRVAGWLSDLGQGQIRIARRVGWQAFISAAAVMDAIIDLRAERGESVTAAQMRDVEDLMEWAQQANEGRCSGLIEDALELFDGELPAGLMPSEVCLSSDCPEQDRFAYETHIEASEAADVVIMTHQYMASSALYRRGKLSERGFTALVVDEADRLVDAAASTFRFNLSLRRLEATLAKIPGKAAESASELTAIAAQAVAEAPFGKRGRALALAVVGQARQANILGCLSNLAAAIGKVSRKGDLEVMQKADLEEAAFVLGRVTNGKQGDVFAAAISISPTKRFPSISMVPIAPGRLLSKIWTADDALQAHVDGEEVQKLSAVLFTSATLGVPGRVADPAQRFKSVAYALGVPTTSDERVVVDTRLWEQFEPVKFGAIRFIIADPSLSSPVLSVDDDSAAILNDEWVSYAADMVRKASGAGGRTLVLTRSYRETAMLSSLLQDQNGRLIEQVREGGLAACVEPFVQDPKSVWISPSAWEGLNLPGMIQNLVITRLPLQQVDEVNRALLTAQGRMTQVAVQSLVQAIAMNTAKRLFRQGMGRAIRARTDKARIWIADPRFPVPARSPLLQRYPDKITFGSSKPLAAFHAVVPTRFEVALNHTAVLLKNGEILNPGQ